MSHLRPYVVIINYQTDSQSNSDITKAAETLGGVISWSQIYSQSIPKKYYERVEYRFGDEKYAESFINLIRHCQDRLQVTEVVKGIVGI